MGQKLRWCEEGFYGQKQENTLSQGGRTPERLARGEISTLPPGGVRPSLNTKLPGSLLPTPAFLFCPSYKEEILAKVISGDAASSNGNTQCLGWVSDLSLPRKGRGGQ